MANEAEKDLTYNDAFGKMNLKIRWTARHLKQGMIELAAELQVVNGDIKQCDISKLIPHERFRADSEH